VLILSCFAVWGALGGGGPFAPATADDGFFLLVLFMISSSVVSLVISADVAGRERVEVKLRRQEQILRAMFAQSVVGIAQIDAAGGFTLANHRFCGVLRRTALEMLLMRILGLIDH